MQVFLFCKASFLAHNSAEPHEVWRHINLDFWWENMNPLSETGFFFTLNFGTPLGTCTANIKYTVYQLLSLFQGKQWLNLLVKPIKYFNICMYLQGSRNILAQSPEEGRNASGQVKTKKPLARRASHNAMTISQNFYHFSTIEEEFWAVSSAMQKSSCEKEAESLESLPALHARSIIAFWHFVVNVVCCCLNVVCSTCFLYCYGWVQPAKREEDCGWGLLGCIATRCTWWLTFTTRCYCETFDIALRTCKTSSYPRRPGPLIVIACANSPRSVTATLHNLPFRAWEQSIVMIIIWQKQFTLF